MTVDRPGKICVFKMQTQTPGRKEGPMQGVTKREENGENTDHSKAILLFGSICFMFWSRFLCCLHLMYVFIV